MSTHPLTPGTEIPFPCWLWNGNGWLYWTYTQPATWHLLQVGYTHYSTNPPDQRPEDVGVVVETAQESCSSCLGSGGTEDERCPSCGGTGLPTVQAPAPTAPTERPGDWDAVKTEHAALVQEVEHERQPKVYRPLRDDEALANPPDQRPEDVGVVVETAQESCSSCLGSGGTEDERCPSCGGTGLPTVQAPAPDAPKVSELAAAIATELHKPKPLCRDCADHNGTCPTDGLPCNSVEREAAIIARHLAPLKKDKERLIAAAERYFAAIRSLSKVRDGQTLFERSPTKDPECCAAWVELNDAGKQIRAAIDAAKKP